MSCLGREFFERNPGLYFYNKTRADAIPLVFQPEIGRCVQAPPTLPPPSSHLLALAMTNSAGLSLRPPHPIARYLGRRPRSTRLLVHCSSSSPEYESLARFLSPPVLEQFPGPNASAPVNPVWAFHRYESLTDGKGANHLYTYGKPEVHTHA